MTKKKKILIAAGALALLAIVVAASVKGSSKKGIEVKTDKVSKRDLTAIITASGKIVPRRKVDISSDVMGRVIELHVDEGDLVRKGDLLLRIDPTQYEANVSRATASWNQAKSGLAQAAASLAQARKALERAERLHQTGAILLSDQQLEDARTAFEVQRATGENAAHGVDVADAALAEAKQNLSKTVIRAPMSGRVTRKNIEAGEVAVIGTMNNPGSLLLTVADLSEMEAVVSVDETDVPAIAIGNPAQIEIDAFPGKKFTGRVSKIGNSSIRGGQAIQKTGDQAVDFEVRIAIDSPPPTLRPDLSATADVTTSERKGVLSIPIIALTVKEARPVADAKAPETGVDPKVQGRADREKRRNEQEGVFLLDKNKVKFQPVEIGIAGENFFEVKTGLEEGALIVPGTYQAIRSLKDGDTVRLASDAAKSATPPPKSEKADAKKG